MERTLPVNGLQMLNESSLMAVTGGGGVAEKAGYGAGYAVGYSARKFRDSVKTSRWRSLSRSKRRIPSYYSRYGH